MTPGELLYCLSSIPRRLKPSFPLGRKPSLIMPKSVAEKIPESLQAKAMVKILANGEKTEVEGISIEAVPAYNTTPGKERFHPKGRDNGYVLTLGGKRVYIAGDAEDMPEMRSLKGIDIAFLPMNLPYTMSVAKAAEAIRSSNPRLSTPTTIVAATATRPTWKNSSGW